MIDFGSLATWLSAVPTALDYDFVVGPRQPEFYRGDLVAVVSPQPGPGLTLDGLGHVPSFEIRLVAREHRRLDLYRSGHQIDKALLFADCPANLWGTRVQYVDRLGGEPALQQEDELDRVLCLCSYIVHEMPEM